MKISRKYIEQALGGNVEAGNVLSPIVRKCAAAGCRKARAPEQAEDIEQELWMFLMKSLNKLDEKYNIEPYLIETARKMALAYKRKFRSFGTDGQDRRVDSKAGLNGIEADDAVASETRETLVDQERALATLLARSPELRRATSKAEKMIESTTRTSTANAASGPRRPRRLTPEQAALRTLRQNAGLTQIDMAARLGLKLPTYQSYEYGRTRRVPKSVVEAAKQLSVDPEYSYIKAMYADRPMRDIVKEWAERMGIPEDHPKDLAAALGVNKSTASRWLSSKVTVTLTADELIAYERRVAREEAYYQESVRRHQGRRHP